MEGGLCKVLVGQAVPPAQPGLKPRPYCAPRESSIALMVWKMM
jgi:hypothetical protein